MLAQLELDLTPGQILQLAKGKTIQVRHHQIHTGHPVVLDSKKVKRAHRAHAAGKGFRLSLSNDEMNSQVGGGKFLDALKKAGQWLKTNIFDSDAYKKNIAPLVRQGLKQVVDRGASTIGTFVPQLAEPARNIGTSLVENVGDRTGAYGLRRRRGGAVRGTAGNPAMPAQDHSKPDFTQARRGRAAKGSEEAREWGQRMRAAKAAKRQSAGSFRAI